MGYSPADHQPFGILLGGRREDDGAGLEAEEAVGAGDRREGVPEPFRLDPVGGQPGDVILQADGVRASP